MNLTDLKYYDELTTAAQAEARRNIAASVQAGNSQNIANALRAYVQDANRAINDPLHVRRIINGGEAWRKIRQEGDAYLIRFIRSNRVIFTPCGAYVAYVGRFTMFKEGREYIPTDDEQKALRTPYIDVNGRGPGFS